MLRTETSIREASDEHLFIDIAHRETAEDNVLAEQAFAELHRRHMKPLYARCLKMCKALPGETMLAEELTTATFVRAYERAGQYRAASNPDAASGRRRTLAWLCQIANNLLRDQLRNPQRPGPLNTIELDVDTNVYTAEDFAVFFLDPQKPMNSQEHKRVAAAFETLDARTQTVLLETCLQRDRSPKKTHMLRGTTRLLADRLGTSTDNIRRIRRNGIRAINDYLEEQKKPSGDRA
jgi:RNA polymerase sigma factor (sigma-70 family)